MSKRFSFLLACLLGLLVTALLNNRWPGAQAQTANALSYQTNDARLFAIGTPVLTDIWIDPVNGNDSNSGATRNQAVRKVSTAWSRIPRDTPFTRTGYRMLLVPGTYGADVMQRWYELRFGTAQFPVIMQAADGRDTVNITTYLNVWNCSYFYFIDLNVAPDPPDFAFHLEKGDHVLLRGMKFDGKRIAGQTVKINNSQHVYLEQSDVANAAGTPLDFVATRHGSVIANRIHGGGNWAMFVKGGSAYFNIEGNELYDAVRGGFTAGQFTGFEYLDAPWVHYEAYDIKFVNNVIHDTLGSGLSVEGGYNILLAHNTLYRTGKESHALEVLFGLRVCAGNTAKCSETQANGGWGTAGTSTNDWQKLPNRNVFIYNNLIYNPADYPSRWAHLVVYGPQQNSGASNIPAPVTLDQNLQIRGNVFWNGPANLALGIEDSKQGCQPGNPTCNATQLRNDNSFNQTEPQLTDPVNGNLRPRASSNLARATTYAIPDFTWNDAPGWPSVPTGNLRNAVTRDFNNQPRGATSAPGAFAAPQTTLAATAVSAASFQANQCAPETILSVFGEQLAATTQMVNQLPLPLELARTRASIRDSLGIEHAAPLFFASPNQVNLLVPATVANGAATLTIVNSSGSNGSVSHSTANIQIDNLAPGLFSANATGRGIAAAYVVRIMPDNTQRFEPVVRYDAAQNRTVAVPVSLDAANERVYLVLFGAGLRRRAALTDVRVTIGGLSTEVSFAAPHPELAGLDQINVPLPRTLAGRNLVELVVTVNGKTSNPVQVQIK